MKNNFNQIKNQIDKSIRNDWKQNEQFFLSNRKRKIKAKLSIKNGKIVREYGNGIPETWNNI